MKKKQRAVVKLLFIIVFSISFFSTIYAQEAWQSCLMSFPKPQTECQTEATGSIYIHLANNSWNSRDSHMCEVEVRGNSLICAETWCKEGIEGEYLMTFHVDGDHQPMQGGFGGGGMGGGWMGLFGGLFGGYQQQYGQGTPDNTKTISAPWSPVNFDEQDWACTACGKGIWEPTADNNNGECCGDDPNDDPDMGSFACTTCNVAQFNDSPGKRDWSDLVPRNIGCCGDDAEDCGLAQGSFLCTDVPFGVEQSQQQQSCPDPFDESCWGTGVSNALGKWYWKDAKAKPNLGAIIDSSCAGKRAYLSDGKNWVLCASPEIEYKEVKKFSEQNPRNVPEINGHGYICYNEKEDEIESYFIGECCGGTATSEERQCNNNIEVNQQSVDFGGRDFFTGQSTKINSKTYFCRQDFEFSEDLDCRDKNCDFKYSCESAVFPNGTYIGLVWTGTHCCSEPSDSNEFYNDKGGTGACFNSKATLNDNLVEGYPELIVLNGSTHGCKIDAKRVKLGNEYFLTLTDTFTNEPLIKNEEFCKIVSNGYFYCDYSEEWKLTYGENLSHFSNIPEIWKDPSKVDAGCCKTDSCWNGTACVQNQAPNPLSLPFSGNYRCSDGEWSISQLKKGLDGLEGYCPRNDQCLVSISGNYEDNGNPNANPICINSGQFLEDNYCEQGNWSTRTKYLALSLLDLASSSSDYTLYCGSYKDTLNYVDYLTKHYAYVKDLFDTGKLNKICVLESRNAIYVATSLNTNFTDEDLDLVGMIPEFEDCAPIFKLGASGTGFKSCNGQSTAQAWSNKNLQSIVYSKRPFNMKNEPPFSELFLKFIKNPFSVIISTLKHNPSTQRFSYELIESSNKFDQLFISKKQNMEIFATMNDGILIGKYHGTSMDFCELIGLYNKTKATGEHDELSCISNGQTFYMVAEGSDFTSINPIKIWSDLTGKLRAE